MKQGGRNVTQLPLGPSEPSPLGSWGPGSVPCVRPTPLVVLVSTQTPATSQASASHSSVLVTDYPVLIQPQPRSASRLGEGRPGLGDVECRGLRTEAGLGHRGGHQGHLVLAKQKRPGWRCHPAAHPSGAWLVTATRVSHAPPGSRWASSPLEFPGPRGYSRLWVQSRGLSLETGGGRLEKNQEKCGAMF